MRHRVGSIVLVVALIAVAAAFWLIAAGVTDRARGYATGDDLDIRFAGWWSGTASDLYDAAGNRIGETFGNWHRPGEHTGEAIFRYYVFDYDTGERDVLFGPGQEVTGAGGRGFTSSSGMEDLMPGEGRARCALQAFFRPKYSRQPLGRFTYLIPFFSRFLSMEVNIRAVDVTFRWYEGPRGRAWAEFEGPLEPGKTYAGGKGSPATLGVADYQGFGGDWGTWLDLKIADRRPPGLTHLVAYDSSGRRHLPNHYWSSLTEVIAILPGLSPTDVSAVTAGEASKSRTFHNIALYPSSGAAVPTYPPYFDEMARRLNIKMSRPSDVEHYSFKSIQEVLAVIDIVRGPSLRDALWYVRERMGDPDNLSISDDDRGKLREALVLYSKADDPYICSDAVCVGLQLDFPAFSPLAFDMLEKSDAALRRNIAMSLAGDRSLFSPDDVSRARKIILENPRDNTVVEPLLRAVCQCRSNQATPVLVEFAQRPEPWIWWPATLVCVRRGAIGPVETLAGETLLRALVAREFQDAASVDETALAAAKKLLLDSLTNDFAAADCRLFKEAIDLAARNCDRNTFLETAISFVRATRNYSTYEDPIGQIARYVNLWHGIDIGGLGVALDQDEYTGDHPRHRIAIDLVKWYETGRVETATAGEGRAADGDVRVLLIHEDNPEKAGIALWRGAAGDGRVVAEVHRLISEGGRLSFQFLPTIASQRTYSGGPPRSLADRTSIRSVPPPMRGKGNSPDVRFRWNGTLTVTRPDGSYRGTTTGEHDIARKDLPWEFEVPMEGWRVVLEPAADPKSVLSGTKVFDDWWLKYGPQSPSQ